MYRLFRSELLKSKRTLLRPTLFIGAVIFSVLLMIVANLAGAWAFVGVKDFKVPSS